jgi:hypothetical protein
VASILTADQAANALRVSNTDPRLLDLLPQVDKFVERATGRDWTQDSTKNPVAISAATILVVMMFENPAMMMPGGDIPFGLNATLAQLEADALKYRTFYFQGSSDPGYIPIPGARIGDQVMHLTGVFGVSGDRSADFANTVAFVDSLAQLSGDLYPNLYAVVLKNPADDVTA